MAAEQIDFFSYKLNNKLQLLSHKLSIYAVIHFYPSGELTQETRSWNLHSILDRMAVYPLFFDQISIESWLNDSYRLPRSFVCVRGHTTHAWISIYARPQSNRLIRCCSGNVNWDDWSHLQCVRAIFGGFPFSRLVQPKGTYRTYTIQTALTRLLPQQEPSSLIAPNDDRIYIYSIYI